jgi:hypothetical protein
MLEAVLLAAAIEYRSPPPRLNPQICANVQRSGPGYIVMKETWVLPMLKLAEGRRLKPYGSEGIMIGGWNMIELIEKTCSAASS